jgi:NADH:ubiquinone oxidoreductase subunit F (NADH-binding)
VLSLPNGNTTSNGNFDRVADGRRCKSEDFIRLQDVGWTMTDASLCGLGQTAASAVLIRDEVVARVIRSEFQSRWEEISYGIKKRQLPKKTR